MASPRPQVTFEAHGQKRLCDPVMGVCVSPGELTAKVEDDEDLVVRKAKNGEDVTHSILKQIILRRANHG
jgi:polyhydroxyalkanoate synthesis regulator protein